MCIKKKQKTVSAKKSLIFINKCKREREAVWQTHTHIHSIHPDAYMEDCTKWLNKYTENHTCSFPFFFRNGFFVLFFVQRSVCCVCFFFDRWSLSSWSLTSTFSRFWFWLRRAFANLFAFPNEICNCLLNGDHSFVFSIPSDFGFGSMSPFSSVEIHAIKIVFIFHSKINNICNYQKWAKKKTSFSSSEIFGVFLIYLQWETYYNLLTNLSIRYSVRHDGKYKFNGWAHKVKQEKQRRRWRRRWRRKKRKANEETSFVEKAIIIRLTQNLSMLPKLYNFIWNCLTFSIVKRNRRYGSLFLLFVRVEFLMPSCV